MNDDAEAAPPPAFDVERFLRRHIRGHGERLGIRYHAHAADWVELALPFADALVGDGCRGVLASGPVFTLMDMATTTAVWQRRGRFAAQATLDMRIDHLRAAVPGRTVIGRGECYGLARSVAFVRGTAHDGDPADPVAHVAGTFMLLDA